VIPSPSASPEPEPFNNTTEQGAPTNSFALGAVVAGAGALGAAAAFFLSRKRAPGLESVDFDDAEDVGTNPMYEGTGDGENPLYSADNLQ
jgi:hypothetical protein